MAIWILEIVRDDPLVLFCSPRGGSSLVAGAFINHGFWVGTIFGGIGGAGYTNHENVKLRDWFKEHYPLDAGNHQPKARRADLRAFCNDVVPVDRHWMFKGLSEYYVVWRANFPRMRAVMVYRDRRQAVEAHVRRRGEKVRQIASRVVRARYAFMDARLKDDPLSWRVDADRLVDGDSGQMFPVLAEYNIILDHRLAMRDIDPAKFHQ